jgi:hypothetical protein
MDAPAIAVSPPAGARLGIMPISFSVKLDKLEPGNYDCQVTILDPVEHRASFWRGPLLLVK